MRISRVHTMKSISSSLQGNIILSAFNFTQKEYNQERNYNICPLLISTGSD